jgi:hypothetical protein
MNQRSIVLYLARNGLTAMGIYRDLVVTLGPDARSDSSVTHFFREVKFPSPNPPTTFSEDNPSLDDSNEAILLALADSRSHQFASYQDSRTYLGLWSTGG